LQRNTFTATAATSTYRADIKAIACRTRLFLARHGALVTSSEWRFVGHRDVALHPDGIRQIQRLSDRLAGEHLDVVYASDLQRTVQSASIIAEPRGLVPITRCAFREINLGVWEGLTMEEISTSFEVEFMERMHDVARYRIRNGESFEDVRDRAIPCLEACLAAHHGQSILIMAHGGVNRVILCHALGLNLDALTRIEQSYGCLNIIDYYDGGDPVVSLMNETIST
jgi:alpha-ribazole phosphatase/probable phosphoglycerate mutase